jgi:hypothetical protein
MTNAEIEAWLDEIEGVRSGRKGKAVLVCVDGRIVGDAVVVVSEDDPNWWRSMSIREGGKITIKHGRRLRWR